MFSEHKHRVKSQESQSYDRKVKCTVKYVVAQ